MTTSQTYPANVPPNPAKRHAAMNSAKKMNKKDLAALAAASGETGSPPPPKDSAYRCKLDSMQDIRREMAKVYRECRAEKIDPGNAVKLVGVLQSVAKTIESCDLEKRIAALEKKR